MAAPTAARLREGPGGTETLTGQGVRDVTRVAAGDPTLWTGVVRSIAPAVAAVLRDVHDDLNLLPATVEALATPTPAAAPDHRAEAARAVTGLLARGVDGASRIRPPSAGARSFVNGVIVTVGAVIPSVASSLMAAFAIVRGLGNGGVRSVNPLF